MAAPVYHDPSVQNILGLHSRFEPAEGLKAEVIGGAFVVSPTSARRHGLIFDDLTTQLKRLLPARFAVTTMVTLDMPATDERYVPDLLVVAKDALRSDEWLLDASEAEMVAEIVSPSNARVDRVVKVRGYATAGVPVYLLVDPLEGAVTLFCEPADGSYGQAHRLNFGAPICLPEPFAGKLDTSEFG